jgi:hypothetical protein
MKFKDIHAVEYLAVKVVIQRLNGRRVSYPYKRPWRPIGL